MRAAGRRAGRRETHKHRGFGGFAQPQVLEPVLLVLAPFRKLFHPGLERRRGPRRGGEAAQQAHGPAPPRGLPGSAGIGVRPRGGGAPASAGLRWRKRALRNRFLQNAPRRALGLNPQRQAAPLVSAVASEVTLPGSYVTAPTNVKHGAG